MALRVIFKKSFIRGARYKRDKPNVVHEIFIVGNGWCVGFLSEFRHFVVWTNLLRKKLAQNNKRWYYMLCENYSQIKASNYCDCKPFSALTVCSGNKLNPIVYQNTYLSTIVYYEGPVHRVWHIWLILSTMYKSYFQILSCETSYI